MEYYKQPSLLRLNFPSENIIYIKTYLKLSNKTKINQLFI